MKNTISFMALGVLVLTGCVQPSAVVECGDPSWARVLMSRSPEKVDKVALVGKNYGMAMTPIPLDAVQFTNKALAEEVAIQSVGATRTATSSVQVTSRFVNCKDKPINMQVRISFMDVNQIPTEPASAWRTVIVPPRATAVYQENSIGRGTVAHYVIEVAP